MSTPSPLICDTCKLPYEVDDSCDAHMNPPTDYRKGAGRYCLACWLGVGPLDVESCDADARQDSVSSEAASGDL